MRTSRASLCSAENVDGIVGGHEVLFIDSPTRIRIWPGRVKERKLLRDEAQDLPYRLRVVHLIDPGHRRLAKTEEDRPLCFDAPRAGHGDQSQREFEWPIEADRGRGPLHPS